MKRFVNMLFITLAAAITGSCDLDTSDNGDLDGMWHLVAVDTLSTSGTMHMDEKMIYWSFQNRLLQLDDKSGLLNSILFRFEHSAGALRLYSPYIYDRINGDVVLTDVIMLMPFGVNALDETFEVEALDGGRLVLRSEELRLRFRKN